MVTGSVRKLDEFVTSFGKLSTVPESINICVMAHNAYWPGITICNSECSCTINTCGDDTLYFNDLKGKGFVDYDFIFLYSSEFFDDETLEELKQIAIDISRKSSKQVVIGYAPLIPHEKRTTEEIINRSSSRVFINKINNGEVNDCTYVASIPPFIDPIIQCLSLMYDISKEKEISDDGKVKGPLEEKK